MQQRIFQIALVVTDYDEAIEFYTEKLGFNLLEDSKISETKRWVRVAPVGSDMALLLAKAASDKQKESVGNQTGGRVFLFMYTDDFDRDYQNLKDQGVKIIRERSKESYGVVAVFADLYGNLWDLIEPASR